MDQWSSRHRRKPRHRLAGRLQTPHYCLDWYAAPVGPTLTSLIHSDSPGSAASFITMMLPPKSGRKAVRLKNANILMQLSSLYSDITAAWISSEGVPDNDLAKSAKEWNPAVRAKVISIATQLQVLRMQTAMAKWEGNIRGVWPMGEYMKLLEVETDIMASLALVSLFSDRHHAW